MSISKEDLNIISQVFGKEVKKAVDAILKAVEQANTEPRNYFKDTEVLLYNYPILKDKIKLDEELLLDPDSIIYPKRKSKDIVRYSSSASNGPEFDVSQYTESVKLSMMRTRAEVARIERALEQIKDDRYYRIIELKYFEKNINQDSHTYDEIARILQKDESTIRRNKNRLISKLKLYLFGAEALTKLT
jgi:RNA polymerase sigma factor (sigma-70 family)